MQQQLPFGVLLDRSPSPESLWDAVINARAAWARERHLPHRDSEPNARLALLDALEAYVKSLDERGHPVQYALRDELRLQQLTCMAIRRVRRMTTREELRHGR
jgi:hypothetical protein